MGRARGIEREEQMPASLSEESEPLNIPALQQRARRLRWWLGVKHRAIINLGGSCARCDFDDERILQLDHVDPRGGRQTTGAGYRQKQEWIRASKGDTDGLQILCPNHHALKTYGELGVISCPPR